MKNTSWDMVAYLSVLWPMNFSSLVIGYTRPHIALWDDYILGSKSLLGIFLIVRHYLKCTLNELFIDCQYEARLSSSNVLCSVVQPLVVTQGKADFPFVWLSSFLFVCLSLMSSQLCWTDMVERVFTCSITPWYRKFDVRPKLKRIPQ